MVEHCLPPPALVLYQLLEISWGFTDALPRAVWLSGRQCHWLTGFPGIKWLLTLSIDGLAMR